MAWDSEWVLCGALVALGVACGDDAPPPEDGLTESDGADSTEGGTVGATTTTTTSTTTIGGSGSSSTTSDVESGSSSSSSGGDFPEPLEPLAAAVLTLDETIVPTTPRDEDATLDPRVVAERQQMLDEGYGEHELGPGEDVMMVAPPGATPPDAGPNRSLVSRFVHLADTQLADDESPLRVATFDTPSIAGGYRPQEAWGCSVLNAAVRSINAIHAQMPLDFVVLGGDNSDSAQSNEVDWFLRIMDGANVVHCDSGDDDDPVPGDGNDPKDRFAPVGLDVPWIWVSGNHDLLVQGNFPLEGREDDAVGEVVPSGGATIDWSNNDREVFVGPVIADPERALLDNPALLAKVAAAGDGHGIAEETVSMGKGSYTWDVPDTDIRFVVVDTATPTGADGGVIVEGHVDGFLRGALDQAEADDKLVIVSSHHASSSLHDGAGLGGVSQPGALEPADWRAFLADYPNVVMHLAGHSHEHRVEYIEVAGARGYWEVVTSGLIDWPHQMRLLEVSDEDNGWLTIRSIAFDYQTTGDDLAAEGKSLGILDYTSGWTDGTAGDPTDRNVELWIERP